MTALGNVMALVQALQEEEALVKGEIPESSGFTFPAACSCVCASSLGDVLGCIREMRGESLREFIATLPPVQAPRSAVTA
ncbi:MAG TPA: hypothetical protein VJ673_19365 [Aromatoleum sp.]|uniref:hypothetical protein n=1 Tax=Aromatoleum sp. TaxID=2307007 RepID=UPI002B4745A0|nr:hypothetical protein [Aromatoleum sp.]HJV27850.1 hypothetical protein [Aromatoleum sp.]